MEDDHKNDEALAAATRRAAALVEELGGRGIGLDLERGSQASNEAFAALGQEATAQYEERIRAALGELESLIAGHGPPGGKAGLESKADLKDDMFRKSSAADQEAPGPAAEEAAEASAKQAASEDRDRFLYWEPEKFRDKVTSFFANTSEVYFVLAISVLALFLSSAVAVGFFLLAAALLVTSLRAVRSRILWGYGVLVVMGAALFAVVVWKVRATSSMDKQTKDLKAFKREIAYYECLGFRLEYDVAALLLDPATVVGTDTVYTYECNMVSSFLFEALLACLMMALASFYRGLQRSIAWLTREDNLIELEAFKEYEEEQERLAEEAEDASRDQGAALGTQALDKLTREALERREREQREEKDKWAKFSKRIRRVFLDSDHFYRQNQKFFVSIILFELLQSMAFNACSDIPALFMLLILFAFYAYRKVYTRAFLQYTFLLVYFIQLTLALKVINESLTRIRFVQEWMTAKETSAFVQLHDLLFGNQRPGSAGSGARPPRRLLQAELLYFTTLYLCFYSCQAWKATKWMEIRYKTAHLPNASLFTRFRAYLEAREEGNQVQARIRRRMQAAVGSRRDKTKAGDQKKRAKRRPVGRFDAGKEVAAKKASRDLSVYLPGLVMWAARVLMFALVYTYHCQASLLHLTWILLSFILELNTCLILSIYAMVPLLSWEFVLIYGVRIPGVRDTAFFQRFGAYFDFEMKAQAWEQTLMFLTLACFYMMISCQRIIARLDTSDSLLTFFRKRCTGPKYSDVWKLAFFALRYVQSLVLLFLFFSGISHINNARNLGYMLFFVVYTAYEQVYRKTSLLLIFFISFFILGQYYFSFVWPLVAQGSRESRYRWLYLYPYENPSSDPFKESKEDTLYFRIAPQPLDWAVLILMNLLQIVNQMYTNREAVLKLEGQVAAEARDRYKRAIYYYERVERIAKSLLVATLLVVMIYAAQAIEVNLINWVFFALTNINLFLLIRGSRTESSLNQSVCVTNIIKVYSLVVMVLDLTFICLVGEFEKPSQHNSLDQRFKRAYPGLYSQLDIIGFRSGQGKAGDPRADLSGQNEESSDVLRRRLTAYTQFFLVSIYLAYHFTTQRAVIRADKHFGEAEYKKLFEFSREEEKQEDGGDKEQRSRPKNEEEARNEEPQGEEVASKAVFRKRASYSYQDLIDFYEKKRFTLPFMVYRALRFWPLFDAIALHGHALSNLAIVYTAILLSVSFYNAFTILCVCLFYLLSAQVVHRMAHLNYDRAGLQSQCDVKMAQLITKRYKSETFQVCLKIRRRIWNCQIFALLLVIILALPASLLDRLREKAALDQAAAVAALDAVQAAKNAARIETIDNVSFWVFMAGLYHRGYALVIAVALVFERLCLNWLEDRCGCTHFNLQKYMELDIRRDSLRYNWLNPSYCKYDLENYRKHYFANDFDQLEAKIQAGDLSEDPAKQQKGAPSRDQVGDFVPVRVARRLKQTISFSVKLDLRCPEIKFDAVTEQKLSEHHVLGQDYFTQADCDYEEVAVLRNHKVECLEEILKQNVNRKYKISYYKGMQLALEGLIMLLLMISIAVKANVYALIYLAFIYRFVATRSKTQLLVRINAYMCILFFAQYALYTLNLSAQTSPNAYPVGFPHYPRDDSDPGDLKIRYPLPWFFRYPAFRDLRIAYLLGVGVDKDQVENLVVDFINLFCVTTYILTFRNPILVKRMVKVFWLFPSPQDGEQWKRLDPVVQDYVRWLHHPEEQQLYDKEEGKKYSKETSNFPHTTLRARQVQMADKLQEFAREYREQNQVDLNEVLTTWVDLKYDHIWSQDFLKKKKQEIKDNNTYYRIVKQGSQLVYITFHIFTMFVVMLSATMRQSVLSLGYVLILLPFIKDGAEVLSQRNIHQNENKDRLEAQVEQLQKELAAVASDSNAENQLGDSQRKELEEKLKEARAKLALLNQKEKQKQSRQSFQQKREERKRSVQKEWGMIRVMRVYLLAYGVLDFTAQILGQLPLFVVPEGSVASSLGFRKIWTWPAAESAREVFSYGHFISRIGETPPYQGLQLQYMNLGLQVLNCVIIATITLQAEIFSSPGYQKYVKQTDGSMDLLVQLAELKAKSITYVYNNEKIRKIVAIQRRKEVINGAVQRIREKLIRWRAFSKTTLVNAGTDAGALDALRTELLQAQAVNKKELREELLKEWSQGQPAPGQRYADGDAGDGRGDEDFEETGAGASPGLEGRADSKKQKQVRFPADEDGEEVEEARADRASSTRISVEESTALQERLANEFVAAKLKKVRSVVKLYLWLNRALTTQVMFINEREDLESLVHQHAAGAVAIQTELERIMTTEALEFIRRHYDHTGGRAALSTLLARAKDKGNILQLTGFDRTIKLKDMTKTWAFTRPVPMLVRLGETMFYVIISQTQTIIYLAMILSMYENAGIISLPYPLAVFGYALLEETRPRREFWVLVRQYTTVILFFKFVLNLSLFEPLLTPTNESTGKQSTGVAASFQHWSALLNLGIYDNQEMWQLTLYMMPEVLIICFIMLHEIRLRLLGLYYEIEEDIESVPEGRERNLEKGDEERVRRKKLQSSNMCLSLFFGSLRDQIFARRDGIQVVKAQLKEELEDELKQTSDVKPQEEVARLVEERYKREYPETSRKDRQRQAIQEVSRGIWDQTRNFDLDTTKQHSDFDALVAENVLQKALEQDDLLFVEGQRSTLQPDFLTREEFQAEVEKPENWDTLSAGDHQEQFDEAFDELEKRTRPALGPFEKRAYFGKLFPALRIQKPGYDLYGAATTVLALTALYVFQFYQHVTVDPAVFGFLKGQSSLFAGEMALVLVAIVIVMLLERYTNRTDTKAEVQQRLRKGGDLLDGQPGFFNQDELFQRTSTARSMTVKLRTMKTADLDMQGNAAQDFLKQMQGEESTGRLDAARTPITGQQKTKFALHWVLLVASHLFVFWYVPLHGNYVLYDQPQCDLSQEKRYGCKDFRRNGYLRVFYLLLCLYLALSALQLRYGFPIMKKPSSVMQYYGDLPNLGALVYAAIPFAIEVRCVLDFTMSKTALDVFQFWQLFQYHVELYNAKNGNRYYGEKRLGLRTDGCEKCLFGVTISSLLLLLLVGPLLLFSTIGGGLGLTAPNPVEDAELRLSLVVDRAEWWPGEAPVTLLSAHTPTAPGAQDVLANQAGQGALFSALASTGEHGASAAGAGGAKKPVQLRSSLPHEIYRDGHGFLRTFDEGNLAASPFPGWTETRSFEASQIQECLFSESAESSWNIAEDAADALRADLTAALNKPAVAGASNHAPNVSLALDLGFTRAGPAEAPVARAKVNRTLNYSRLDDCHTGKQLQKFVELDCAAPHAAGSPGKSVSIFFTRVITPDYVLGQTKSAEALTRSRVDGDPDTEDGIPKVDLRLTYRCRGQWRVEARARSPDAAAESTPHFNYSDVPVDASTCEPLDPQAYNGTNVTAAMLAQWEGEEVDGYGAWSGLPITLFSVLVSASLLAAWSPTTFYGGIVYAASAVLRPALIFGTWTAWVYECTNPDPVIKVVEACYMKRHEEDFVGEEEAYRMLQEIVRSPELFKALTGSSLKGPTDPALDRLSADEQAKLAHLSKLEEKGFDVRERKDALTGQLGVKPGENLSALD